MPRFGTALDIRVVFRSVPYLLRLRQEVILEFTETQIEKGTRNVQMGGQARGRQAVGCVSVDVGERFFRQPDGGGQDETSLWQRKIDAAAAAGGGVVAVPAGEHTVAQLRLGRGGDMPLFAHWPGRWRGIHLIRCRDVRLDGFTLQNAHSWGCFLAAFAASSDAPWIVLTSHYDTKPGVACPGANDGASTSGLLIALAARLARQGVPGDENVLLLCLDMLGGRDLAVSVPANGSAVLKGRARRAARCAGVPVALLADSVIDDHVPFLDAGFEAIGLIDTEYGSAPGLNDHWHTPSDTVDKLSPASLEKAVRLATELLRLEDAVRPGENAARRMPVGTPWTAAADCWEIGRMETGVRVEMLRAHIAHFYKPYDEVLKFSRRVLCASNRPYISSLLPPSSPRQRRPKVQLLF